MKHVVDARGLICPLPVVNTKNEIENMEEGESVDVLVDNEIAVQNLSKFANVRGYGFSHEKTDDVNYQVTITVSAGNNMNLQKDLSEDIVCDMSHHNNDVVVISAETMGQGEKELGKALMKAFVFALTKQDSLPETVILYNSGAFLSCEESDSLEDLLFMEGQGTEILTCGTCLNFYGMTDKLAVGNVTNMYDIVRIISGASKVIRP